MKELITIAFRQVRGVRDIYLPEDSSIQFQTVIENLQEVLSVHDVTHVLIESSDKYFYLIFSSDRWIGVITDSNVNEVLIRAALERAVKVLRKHSQFCQRVKHIHEDIEDFFSSMGSSATVRKIDLSVEDSSLSGKIRLSARRGRIDTVREQLHQFLERQLPYFMKNNVNIIIEPQSLLDRITRDQLTRIIRRVERL